MLSYNSRILEKVKLLLDKIDRFGIEINETKEVTNSILSFEMNTIDLEEEENQIRYYYNRYVEDYDRRSDLEKDHYNFLSAFLIHKLKEIQYFHHLDKDDYTSRKNVIWSNDCISSIQFLHREDKNILNIFIRSSDVLRLLPIDLLYGIKLLNIVLDRFNIKKTNNDLVTFFTTSSHFYIKDQEVVNKIIHGL